MRKILVVYYQQLKSDRNTINEHLYAFSRYADSEVLHYNAAGGLPWNLSKAPFDLMIFHYTFLAVRWNGRSPFRRLMTKVRALKPNPAKKLAFPQDEYVHSEILCEFFREFAIDAVFTCYDEADRKIAYPDRLIGHTKFYKTFTGYVDNVSAQEIAKFIKPHSQRTFDVGYRARKVPFWLGHHGTLKWRLTEEFLKAASEKDLKLSVSNDPRDVFLGTDWYRFLGDCRVVLGCEGGATVHDPIGKIRSAVDAFTALNPDASFEKVAAACFPGQDDALNLKTLSPRHFEAVLTKTCQALVEGHYEGVFRPDIHYIPIAKDFSNFEQVIKKIEDRKYCEEMAERAFKDIVQNGQFTYRDLVRSVLDRFEVPDSRASKASRFAHWQILLNDSVFVPLARWFYKVKTLGFKAMELGGLVQTYRTARRRLLAWED